MIRNFMQNDGAIYGICQNATGVLRIDVKNQTATIHGDFPQGGHKWHGGVKAPDGSIWGIPANADQVLKVRPRPCIFGNRTIASDAYLLNRLSQVRNQKFLHLAVP